MTLNRRRLRLFVFLASSSITFLGCDRSDRPSGSTLDPKAQIQQFLLKQTGQKQFTPGMDLDLPNRVITLRSNATVLEQRTKALRDSRRTTEKNFAPMGKQMREAIEGQLQDAARAEAAARAEVNQKQEELSLQENTYIRSIRQQMAGVRSYDAMYRLIGEQLATADALLADSDRARRRMGLKMAREACGHMRSRDTDVWLAARICEAYFWPNLDLADADSSSRENALELLETSRRVFFNTDETNNVLKNYSLLLSNAPHAKAADTFRVQLADWLEEKGNLKYAAEILSEIRDIEVLASAHERITRVRDRVAHAP